MEGVCMAETMIQKLYNVSGYDFSDKISFIKNLWSVCVQMYFWLHIMMPLCVFCCLFWGVQNMKH